LPRRVIQGLVGEVAQQQALLQQQQAMQQQQALLQQQQVMQPQQQSFMQQQQPPSAPPQFLDMPVPQGIPPEGAIITLTLTDGRRLQVCSYIYI
jgi:hypothetical protein